MLIVEGARTIHYAPVMSASVRTLSLEEFLAWERSQDLRYEFDGVQPIGMTGGSVSHARLIARLITAAGNRVQPPCEVLSSDLKVIGEDWVRYPDVTVACEAVDTMRDSVSPSVVFEVLSPSTVLTDRRVKPREYRTVPSLRAYVILSQDQPEITVLRRSSGWEEETLRGTDAVLSLPEIGIEIPLAEVYR